MSTSLVGNLLTLNNTTLTEDKLNILTEYNGVTVNVGATVYLDGIECVCIATGVTIQGSTLTRIAIDKNYDLSYYQGYAGKTQDGTEIAQLNYWRWGGYGYSENTPSAAGYGLYNTNMCLANSENFTGGSSNNPTYPLMWIGVKDFRASHSDKWFVPSSYDLKNYAYPNRSSLSFDSSIGGYSDDYFWSSSGGTDNYCWCVRFSDGKVAGYNKQTSVYPVRLCRAF